MRAGPPRETRRAVGLAAAVAAHHRRRIALALFGGRLSGSKDQARDDDTGPEDEQEQFRCAPQPREINQQLGADAADR